MRSAISSELRTCLQNQHVAFRLTSGPMSCRASMMNLVRDLKAVTDAGLSPSQLATAAVATEGLQPNPVMWPAVCIFFGSWSCPPMASRSGRLHV